MATDTPLPAAEGEGAFAPLREKVFAVLWVATVLGNVGSFMRDIASAWIVTELSTNPAAVAAVQAAATLPIFLFAIPAGVLSDILDRRRFLIAVQCVLALVSATLLVLAHTGTLSVSSLIALTFAGGVGAALMGPTWQSIVPELVPRRQLKGAVALNSLGVNISRAIGPALGGLLLAAFGAAFTYGVDLISYAFVIAALLWWRRPPAAQNDLSEHFLGAFRAGMRYTRASRELHVVLVRAVAYFVFASAMWALMPLVVRQLLGGSASFYGLMLGAVGVGAIGGALALPRLRQRLSADGLMGLAAAITAGVMLAMVVRPPQAVALLLALVLGGGWIIALTTLNSVVQAILPNWVRGRGLAVYLTVFNGAMAAGSLGWGLVARTIELPMTLVASAAGMLLIALVMRRLPLPSGEANLDAANHWPEPTLVAPDAHDRGPVLIQVTYCIRQQDRPAFLKALHQVSLARRRDGAYAWGVCESTDDPEQILEWFFVESWAEHMRQHRRVSHHAADQQQALLQFHAAKEPPAVRHFLGLAPDLSR
jgi:MFS family permease